MDMPKNYAEFFEKAREVYSWFEDEQSKRIFEARFAWSGTGSDTSVDQIVLNSCSIVKNSVEIFEQNHLNLPQIINKPVVIYGAGLGGKNVYNDIKDKCTHDIIFMDRNAEILKKDFEPKIIEPSAVSTVDKNSIFIVCTSGAIVSVLQFLLDNGILKSNIYLGTEGDIKEQYFDFIVKFSENEVFADVGCYDGQTSLEFMQRCPNYKKVYCFEPDKDNIELINQNINGVREVELFPYGLWNEKDTLSFCCDRDDGCAISDNGNVQINVDSLDSLMKERKQLEYPTFIKMDIEGAELNALIGAKNTIKENKPKLAISIYHKPEDILELVIYLKELVPVYKFYLRHYTNKAYDTVLYAVVD